jgi:putative transposase
MTKDQEKDMTLTTKPSTRTATSGRRYSSRARIVDTGGQATPVTRALYRLMQDSLAMLIAAALEAELQEFLSAHASLRTGDGAKAVVRNGYLPPRTIVTSVGEITVRVPRTRDRSDANLAFSSALLPPYLSRSRVNHELPQIFLRCCLGGDACSLLEAVLGSQVADASEGVASAVRAAWAEQCGKWRTCAADGGTWLFWWAGSVPDLVAGDELLFIIGLHHDGRHALVAVAAGDTGSESAWPDLLWNLRRQGTHDSAKLCEAGHRPDIWQAVKRNFPDTLILGFDGPASDPLTPRREQALPLHQLAYQRR